MANQNEVEVLVRRVPEGLILSGVHIPVSEDQVGNLVGQVLTHIDAMALDQTTKNASKSLLKRAIWAWWDGAIENSLTSAQGCLGPIKVVTCGCDGINSFCAQCSAPSNTRVVRVGATNVSVG